jgi:hypothetical protein
MNKGGDVNTAHPLMSIASSSHHLDRREDSFVSTSPTTQQVIEMSALVKDKMEAQNLSSSPTPLNIDTESQQTSGGTLPFAMPANHGELRYDLLKQQTLKPLVEVLFDSCRSAWWLLVLTGMVWGNDEMWNRLRNSVFSIDRRGKCHYYVQGDLPIEDVAHESSLIQITFTVTMKKIVCRGWFLLIRAIVLVSIAFIIFIIQRGQVQDRLKVYSAELTLFYVAMLVQAITTLVTTRLLNRRLYSFAPQYTIPYYRTALPFCFLLLGIAILQQVIAVIEFEIIVFFVGLSNFTLLTCLMFILVDIQSSDALVEHLTQRLKWFEKQLRDKTIDQGEEVNPLITRADEEERSIVDSMKGSSSFEISFQEYELIRTEILQRVSESWYINTFAVTVAGLNVLVLCVGVYSFMRVFTPLNNCTVILQLGKEIIFLLIVFCYSATMNSKAQYFIYKLGNYIGSCSNRSMNVWLYASLNPIAFKLGGYVATWKSIALQVLSLAIGVVVGYIKTAILSQ